MSDLISRQAAIDAVGSMLRRKFGIGGDLAEITLAGLPSAQPETHDKRTETHMCNSISRHVIKELMLKYGFTAPDMTVTEFVEDILPSARQWIPTSKTETIPDHEVLCCDKYTNQMVGYLTNDHGEWICESDSEVMYDTIAWMPLPEPYKGDEE